MLRLHQRPLFEPPAKIHLDVVSSHIRELNSFESLSQMLQCPLVDRVSLFRAKRRLGKVLQVKVRPFSKLQVLPATQRGQRVIVSGLQTLSEAHLRFAPVFGKSRFPSANTVLIAVPHPQDLRPAAFIQAPIMLHWSCQFSTSCLNCARKDSNSDFKKRMWQVLHEVFAL